MTGHHTGQGNAKVWSRDGRDTPFKGVPVVPPQGGINQGTAMYDAAEGDE